MQSKTNRTCIFLFIEKEVRRLTIKVMQKLGMLFKFMNRRPKFIITNKVIFQCLKTTTSF